MTTEPVLILLKPDCLERRLWGVALEWLQRQTDLHISDMKMVTATSKLLMLHYAEHEEKPFFPGLIEAMRDRRLVVISGITESGIPSIRDAVMRFRRSWQTDGPRNLLHCSDTPTAAIHETAIWFS